MLDFSRGIGTALRLLHLKRTPHATPQPKDTLGGSVAEMAGAAVEQQFWSGWNEAVSDAKDIFADNFLGDTPDNNVHDRQGIPGYVIVVCTLAVSVLLVLLVIGYSFPQIILRYAHHKTGKFHNISVRYIFVRLRASGFSLVFSNIVLLNDAHLDLMNQQALGGYLPCRLSRVDVGEVALMIRVR